MLKTLKETHGIWFSDDNYNRMYAEIQTVLPDDNIVLNNFYGYVDDYAIFKAGIKYNEFIAVPRKGVSDFNEWIKDLSNRIYEILDPYERDDQEITPESIETAIKSDYIHIIEELLIMIENQ